MRIRHPAFLPVMTLSVFTALAVAGDWSQWRGPNRNGVINDKVALAETWPADGPKVLWDSESIPSHANGGHGSVVVVGDKAYLSVVWHMDSPTQTRAIDTLVLRKLGYRNIDQSEPWVAKMEAARKTMSRRLRGSKLDAWIDQWVEDNLDPKGRLKHRGYIRSRFREGDAAIPLPILDQLAANKNHRFDNAEAMIKWLDEQKFPDAIRQKIIKAVPDSEKTAKDVVICLETATGNTLWKSELPGAPTGRSSSSTPCVADGRLYAVGSKHVYCLDANSGKPIWSTEMPTKAIASSFIVADGKAIVLAGQLTAYDAVSGKQLWAQKDVSGTKASAVTWKHNNKTYVLCNSNKNISCVDIDSGNVVWTAPGGGDSTLAIDGNHLVVFSRDDDVGLTLYELAPDKATKRWSHALLTRRYMSSPIIHNGHVYLLGGGVHLCVNVESGKIAWREPAKTELTSPLLVNGKLLVLQNRGRELVMLSADPAAYKSLATAPINALACPTPALAGGRLYVRHKDRVRCYNLAAPGK